MSILAAIAFIKKHERFLITTHTSMEGDALGSQLGFYYLVRKMGKQAVMVNDDAVPYGYEFLPDLDKIKHFQQSPGKLRFDCLVLVDCSDLKRSGGVYTLNSANKPVLNIDHHISNSDFGSVNWVDPKASSASEMIYQLYKKTGVRFDKNSALALYAGILTDTGSFRFSNTSPAVHSAVAELLKQGIDVSGVYNNIYGNIPLSDLKLLMNVLPTMKTALGGKVAWFEISKEVSKKQKGIFFDLGESLLSFARTLKGLEAVALFRENFNKAGEVRVNFRSQGEVDVNKIANSFGGGGHKSASGATIRGLSLKDARKVVLNKLMVELRSLKR
jgi:bifunctional oligoribonuclease and PAP phosphatase NrnA